MISVFQYSNSAVGMRCQIFLTGEPIVEFTGVHQNHARGELVQDWAYTTMNSDEKWERERTVS